MDVLVTRPIEAGHRTAQKLGLRDHRCILAPVILIRATEEAPPPGPFDAVMVTSAAAMIAGEALTPFAHLPAFAVGARTAEVARRVFANVTEGESDITFLAVLLTHALPEGSRVLVPCGRERRDVADAAFAAAGIELCLWTVYAAEPVDALPQASEQRILSGRIDAVLHYSARSAQLFVNLAQRRELLPHLANVLHVCLAPNVAAPVRSAGLHRVAIAAEPNEKSLLEELDRYAR